jgi:alanine racemase
LNCYQIPQSQITVNKKAIRNNLSFFKKLQNTNRVFPVIKANGYGHGASLIVKATDDLADGYCIHSIFELDGFSTTKNVIILGYFLTDIRTIATYLKNFNLFFTVFDFESLLVLEKASVLANKKINVYIKLETGTNRLGVNVSLAEKMLDYIFSNKTFTFCGFSMHFANIEDTTDHSFAKQQLDRFLNKTNKLTDKKCSLMCACSAAALLFEETRMDIVRLGISLYGYFSSRETFVSFSNLGSFANNPLSPALVWETNPIQIKKVKAGEYIGYGLTYKVTRDMKIAVLPVGYSDGFDRRLSNCGYVLIKGQRAPVCGRVCMNLTMVDISHIENVSVNDTVVLIGKSGEEEITADTMANLTGSINYQILACLNPLIPRKLK